MFKISSAIVLFLIYHFTAVLSEWLSGVTPCRISDGRYNECVVKFFEDIKPHFAKGIPEIKLPALDPFTPNPFTIDEEVYNFKVSGTIKNIKIEGISGYILEKIDVDVKNLIITAVLKFPNLHLTGDFDVKGKIISLPLNGKGSYDSVLPNIRVEIYAVAKEYQDSENISRLSLKEFSVKTFYDGGHMTLSASPLYYLPMKAIQAFFNMQPNLCLRTAKPMVDPVVTKEVKWLVEQVLSSIAKEDLLQP